MSTTPPKTVLVTGANGYLSSVVIHDFLQHGYKVKGTVRSLAKAEGVKGYLYPQYADTLSFVVVDDMTKEGVYESVGALDGVDVVCHVASPLIDPTASASPNGVDWVRDLVNPALQGALTILRSASHYPQVQHFILTSSSAAVAGVSFDRKTSTRTLTEEDWNTATAEDPGLATNQVAAYFASKATAERAAWDFVKNEKVPFILTSFCPPFFFGPAAIKPQSVGDFGSSLGIFYRLLKGGPVVFPVDGSFVDVRDIAAAYRAVVETPITQHERFVLTGGATTTDEVAAFARTQDPTVLQDRFTHLIPEKAHRLLGWKARPKRETFVDMAEYLKEAEKNFTK